LIERQSIEGSKRWFAPTSMHINQLSAAPRRVIVAFGIPENCLLTLCLNND
jgi:hypothetical protein